MDTTAMFASVSSSCALIVRERYIIIVAFPGAWAGYMYLLKRKNLSFCTEGASKGEPSYYVVFPGRF